MVGTLPPTSYLRPIKQISAESIDSLNDSIQYLRSIYNPEVRGSRRRKYAPASPNCISTVQAMELQLPDASNALRINSFERAYAIKWLTALISTLGSDDEISPNLQERENTMHNAASLLAVCSGTSGAGTIVRDFKFSYHPMPNDNSEPLIPITVRLTDISLDNDDYGSVGAQTWGGACVLSGMVIEDPGSFGLNTDQLAAREHGVFRILELGAGTGLVSISVWKMLQNVALHGSHRVEIIATDYYPSVLKNLCCNTESNVPLNMDSPATLQVYPLDWSRFGSNGTRSQPFDQPFDLVLGADIVYEPDHAEWIRSCLIHLLRKPSVSPINDTLEALFHLVIPLRSTHALESSSIETVFAKNTDSSSPSLCVISKDTLTYETESGEEVEYAYYKIGWI
ncbi:hypothetical protein P691DRAFT_777246 [Macrolepiota fuliginosa MF-IS2]|uniref:S-adenosyl-L-methionine-dependent methyltransferase n=1 Tax=Macrolepiota fuliginosa MF-IS2 TaxID=1400762 RepID=A0A9P5X6S0_9AGAR|nr:hypothetical protein P691DRAFT_777246 [Macrolepiota fuliginosa MF-IS2]